MQRQEIIEKFREYNIIKTGEFTLKDGSISDFYIDLRLLISYPKLLRAVCVELGKLVKELNLRYTHIAGIPLAGVPIATILASELDASGLLIRKEAKDYGRKQMVEGVYEPGDLVLLVDDVVTSATSKREAIGILGYHLLQCNDILVIVDRRTSEIPDLNIHSLFTVDELIG